MSDDKAEAEIRRAARAAELLDPDGLLMECFAQARASYFDAWKGSPERDVEGRERIFARLRAMADIEALLSGMVGDGTLARHRVDQAERDKVMQDNLAAAARTG